MSGSLNEVTLIGHLGKDAEIRATQAGKKVASFSLATSESWKDRDGERQTKTEWHNVVVFNEGLAKVVEGYLKKGSHVFVRGSLQTRKWTDKQGNDRYSTEVVLQGFSSQLVMLNKVERGEYSDEQRAGQQSAPASSLLDEDAIPF